MDLVSFFVTWRAETGHKRYSLKLKNCRNSFFKPIWNDLGREKENRIRNRKTHFSYDQNQTPQCSFLYVRHLEFGAHFFVLVTTVLHDSGLARNPSARIENSAEGESQWGRLSKTRLSFLAFHWFRGVSVAYDIIPLVQWNERIQPMASADEVEVLQVFQINWVN